MGARIHGRSRKGAADCGVECRVVSLVLLAMAMHNMKALAPRPWIAAAAGGGRAVGRHCRGERQGSLR